MEQRSSSSPITQMSFLQIPYCRSVKSILYQNTGWVAYCHTGWLPFSFRPSKWLIGSPFNWSETVIWEQQLYQGCIQSLWHRDLQHRKWLIPALHDLIIHCLKISSPASSWKDPRQEQSSLILAVIAGFGWRRRCRLLQQILIWCECKASCRYYSNHLASTLTRPEIIWHFESLKEPSLIINQQLELPCSLAKTSLVQRSFPSTVCAR